MKGAGASGSFLNLSSAIGLGGKHIWIGSFVGFGGNVQTKIGKVVSVKQLKGVRGFIVGCCIGFDPPSSGSSSVYLNI